MPRTTRPSDHVGAYDAKTHLPRLLERVERGERITITRHGKPVARLVPIEEDDRASAAAAVKRIKAARKGNRLAGLSVAELIQEGRRF